MQLLSIKKLPLSQKGTANLEWTMPKGKHELTLSVVCDSYIGADREIALSVDVGEGEEEDESDEDASDGDVEMAT